MTIPLIIAAACALAIVAFAIHAAGPAANPFRRRVGLRTIRRHDRADGPVVIDPDERERIVVHGNAVNTKADN